MHRSDQETSHGQAVWTRLVRAATAVQARIETALKAQGLPPLGWYDALWEVERAGTEGLRQFELQQRLLLPQYGLSRLLARIAEAGLIARAPCPVDGRGQILTITAEGRHVRAAMWPVYAAAMEEAVGGKLTEAEAVLLAGLLARFV